MDQPDLFGGAPVRPTVTLQRGAFAGRWTLDELVAEIAPAQRVAVMYGRRIPVPRLEAWYGLRPYAFGGRVEQPRPWPKSLVTLMGQVEFASERAGARTCIGAPNAHLPFDSCFANLYRSGADHIPWHSDSDDWIGPVVASVTFGAERRFRMRLKRDHAVTWETGLGDGDLLVMHAGTQRDWEHCVPPAKGPVGPRLNLTFRQTVGRVA